MVSACYMLFDSDLFPVRCDHSNVIEHEVVMTRNKGLYIFHNLHHFNGVEPWRAITLSYIFTLQKGNKADLNGLNVQIS